MRHGPEMQVLDNDGHPDGKDQINTGPVIFMT